MTSYALIFAFGEFWDFSSFLYKQEDQGQRSSIKEKEKVKIVFLRSNSRFQTYMRELLEVFSGEMMRQVTVEKEMEVIY